MTKSKRINCERIPNERLVDKIKLYTLISINNNYCLLVIFSFNLGANAFFERKKHSKKTRKYEHE